MTGRLAWAALAGWGAALALRPAATARAVCGAVPAPPTAVTRVLGARQVLQSLVLLRRPSRPLTTAAAVVDGLHAASMLAATVVWPRYRRPALTSAAVAAGSAAVTLAGRPR